MIDSANHGELSRPRPEFFPRLLLLAGLLLLLGVTYLARPIIDYDFFWHLKTGEWIAQNLSLPQEDPFTFTTSGELSPREQFILKGYWLAQLLYYGLYSLLGFTGFLLLRVAVVTGLFLAVAPRRDIDPIRDFALLGLLFIQLLHTYPLERPHVFSFLFFAILLRQLGTLEQSTARNLPRSLAAGVTLLFLVWGNMHGGFMIGQLVLLLFALSALARARLAARRNAPAPPLKPALTVVGIGLAASLLNPHTADLAGVVRNILSQLSLNTAIDQAFLYQTNTEYVSIYQFFTGPGGRIALITAGFLVLSAAQWLRQARAGTISPFRLGLWLGTGIYTCIYFRYAPFFLIAAFPLAREFLRDLPWRRTLRPALVVLLLLALLMFSRLEFANWGMVKEAGWVHRSMLPVSAARFVRENQFPGNLFNYYGWGGYLIWELAPRIRIFCDGRTLDPEVYREYLQATVLEVFAPGQSPRWRQIFEKYDIRLAILPQYIQGRPYPLSLALSQDRDWLLAFNEQNALVFVKIPRY